MSYLEVFATVFTLICVWLTVKRSIWCWPAGIIGVSAYFFVFYQSKLYADMGLQVIFLAQSIYGWYFWLHGKEEDKEEEAPAFHATPVVHKPPEEDQVRHHVEGPE